MSGRWMQERVPSASAAAPSGSDTPAPASLSSSHLPFEPEASTSAQPYKPYLQRGLSSGTLSSATFSTATFSPASLYYHSDASPTSEAIQTPRDGQPWFPSATDGYLSAPLESPLGLFSPGTAFGFASLDIDADKRARHSPSLVQQGKSKLSSDLKISIPTASGYQLVSHAGARPPQDDEDVEQYIQNVQELLEEPSHSTNEAITTVYRSHQQGVPFQGGMGLGVMDAGDAYWDNRVSHPVSAPPYQTTFARARPPIAPGYSTQHSPVHAQFQYSVTSPVHTHHPHQSHIFTIPTSQRPVDPAGLMPMPPRPQSAPPSPDLTGGHGALGRRRGSSLDAFPFPAVATSSGSSVTRTRPQTSPGRPTRGGSSSSSKRFSPITGMTSPKGRKPKAATAGFAFINFTQADSQHLMSGVAPSGSSKKRRLDDEPMSPDQQSPKRSRRSSTKD